MSGCIPIFSIGIIGIAVSLRGVRLHRTTWQSRSPPASSRLLIRDGHPDGVYRDRALCVPMHFPGIKTQHQKPCPERPVSRPERERRIKTQPSTLSSLSSSFKLQHYRFLRSIRQLIRLTRTLKQIKHIHSLGFF